MQSSDLVTISGSDLPPRLRELHKPPLEIHLKGNISLLTDKPKVSIVGARKYSAYGAQTTRDIARAMARAGVVVVSGLALGIDSIAHRACLEEGGETIAVLPSGLESVYPIRHRPLANEILNQNGLMISEYAHDATPRLYTFLQRNRIIAAMADIVILPEASRGSGSLSTANHALELGRTIMAVPGSIYSPYSSGTNRLIASGAMPLLSTDDILTQLGLQNPSHQKIAYIPENEVEAAILAALERGARQTNDIIETAKQPAALIQTHLTLLEIKDVLRVESGQWFIK